MKLVRHGVFETNSSSCHSLSIGASGTYDGITPNEDNLIIVDDSHEFGWSQETYSYPEARLAYAYIYAMDWSGDKRDEFIKTLQEVVCEHTGAGAVTHEVFGKKWNDGYGYIDHQSVESADLHYIFEDKSLLKSFIFDSSSWIETDNDNH